MSEDKDFDGLDSFDHVVVLMLENRSFDNLLGYLYPTNPTNPPLGKTFEGLSGKEFKNPVPKSAKNQPPDGSGEVSAYEHPVKKQSYYMPYPDPGEEYHHVNTQLFNKPDGGDKSPYNFPPGTNPYTPGMDGFVSDYISAFKKAEGKDPTYEDYKQIMGSFPPKAVNVMSTLATEFAVFDHWFCSVPSQTWCNRAFWNAGSSWGHVNNGGSISTSIKNDRNSLSWERDSYSQTIFNQIHETGSDSPLDWNVYSDNVASLTGIIHNLALSPYHIGAADHFPEWSQFYSDCSEGKLPSYSFLEPRFWAPHNDMHPSTFESSKYGKGNVGSVFLGEKLIWDVYNAIKNSKTQGGSNSQNTLLIITFDEHGGCYDHLPPTKKVVNPDDFPKWMDFDFKRLGVRVPTIMVSAHIAKNTIVNDVKDHTSFIQTMQKKWRKLYPKSFPPLSQRSANAPDFSEVFTSPTPRPASTWPEIPEPILPSEFFDTDFSDAPLSDLHQSMLGAISAQLKASHPDKWQDHSGITTTGEAESYIAAAVKSAKSSVGTTGSQPEQEEEAVTTPTTMTMLKKIVVFFKKLFEVK